jgi:hypothetical protein
MLTTDSSGVVTVPSSSPVRIILVPHRGILRVFDFEIFCDDMIIISSTFYYRLLQAYSNNFRTY